jgi:hypothetical protein
MTNIKGKRLRNDNLYQIEAVDIIFEVCAHPRRMLHLLVRESGQLIWPQSALFDLKVFEADVASINFI